MRKLLAVAILLFICVVLAPSMALAGSVFAEGSIDYGTYQTMNWMTWSGDNTIVPTGKVLKVYTVTLSYFPGAQGTFAQVDISGRNKAGTAVWRTQAVGVEPRKPVHLTFPEGLVVQAGGHVEIGFVNPTGGSGTIFASINGNLSAVTTTAP